MIVVSCPDCGKPVLLHLAREHRCTPLPMISANDKSYQHGSPEMPPLQRAPLASTLPELSEQEPEKEPHDKPGHKDRSEQ
jgi:hypothetical protein